MTGDNVKERVAFILNMYVILLTLCVEVEKFVKYLEQNLLKRTFTEASSLAGLLSISFIGFKQYLLFLSHLEFSSYNKGGSGGLTL